MKYLYLIIPYRRKIEKWFGRFLPMKKPGVCKRQTPGTLYDRKISVHSTHVGGGAGGSGMLTTIASVVRTVEATEAAFSRALRQTFVGSTMPAAIMSQYSSFAASKP